MASDHLPDLLQTIYRPDLNTFVGRWGYQPDPALLPAAYELLTREALATGCRFWLQDIRRRTLNDPATTKWLLTEYFPRMAAQLGGRLAVAYLASPTLLQMLLASPSYLLPEAYDNQPFAVAFFSEEGKAAEWLAQQQH